MFNNLPSPMKVTYQLATALAQSRRINQTHWNSYGEKIIR